MKTKSITAEYGYTLQVKDGSYIKLSFRKEAELEPADDEDSARNQLVDEVIDTVTEKILLVWENLKMGL